MIFTEMGEVANGLYVLGSRHVPIYLLRAQKPVLFDAGIVEYDPIPLPKQPEPAYLANLEARVRSISAYSGLEPPHDNWHIPA